MIEAAIHQRVICAIFSFMYGRRMLSDGFGFEDIMAKAKRHLGPHSLECGRYVYDLHFMHFELGG